MKQSTKDNQNIISSLVKLLKPYRRQAIALIGISVLFEMLKLSPPYILSQLLDTVLQFEPGRINYLAQLIGAFFVISVTVTGIDVWYYTKMMRTIISAETHLLREAEKKLLSLSLGYHESHHTGGQINRLHRGVDKLSMLMFNIAEHFMPTLVQIVLTFILMTVIFWQAAAIAFVPLPFFFAFTHYRMRKLQPIRDAYHEKFEEAAAHIGEVVGNIRTVQDFGQEKRSHQQYGSLLERYADLNMLRHWFEAKTFVARDFMLNFGRALTMAATVYWVYKGLITPGELVLFITLTEKMYLALFRISQMYNHVSDSVEVVRRLTTLFEQEEAVVDKRGAMEIKDASGAIEFKNVSFQYLGGEEAVKGMSFSIAPKEVIALCGRSGGGKTTIVKLLFRHFDVRSGGIFFDGIDIRDFKKHSFRRHLAIVSQDIEIFHDTIRYNLTYGRNDITDEEMIEAAKIAHAHEFISRFARGYGTLVGERGVRLSGGQKQRVGIARAILKNPAVMVFDEATSSLDTESERLIQDAILKISHRYTMIIIAHRLSTIESADKILVIDEGRLVEQGTHAQLMRHGGIFASMRELQRLGEIRE